MAVIAAREGIISRNRLSYLMIGCQAGEAVAMGRREAAFHAENFLCIRMQSGSQLLEHFAAALPIPVVSDGCLPALQITEH